MAFPPTTDSPLHNKPKLSYLPDNVASLGKQSGRATEMPLAGERTKEPPLLLSQR